MDTGRDAPSKWDFFVSYTQADRAWAVWVSWVLEDAGYQVFVQDWDFVPGSNWVELMQRAVTKAARTIAVLSDDYLRSAYGNAEWRAAWAADPEGVARKLLPVRVRSCDRPGLLSGVTGFDLFGLSEGDAQSLLLSKVQATIKGRAKPAVKPGFPGRGGTPRQGPRFPGKPPPGNPQFTGPGAESGRLTANLAAGRAGIRDILATPTTGRARHKVLLTRIAAVSLVLLIIGTIVFTVARNNRQRERTAAAANDVASESQAASAPGRAAALAVTAYQLDPTSEAYASVLAAIGKEGPVNTILRTADTPVTGLAVSSDGRSLAVFRSGGTATMVDITDPAHPLITGPAPAGSNLKPGPTGVQAQMLAVAEGSTDTYGGSTQQSATATDGSDSLSELSEEPGFLEAMSLLQGMSDVETSLLSPDGKTLAVAAGQSVTLYDTSSGSSPFSTASDDSFASLPVTQPVDSLAFTPNGGVLAIASGNAVLLWSLPPVIAPGQLIRQVCSQGDELTRHEWSQYVPAGTPYTDICAS